MTRAARPVHRPAARRFAAASRPLSFCEPVRCATTRFPQFYRPGPGGPGASLRPQHRRRSAA
ncbi:hypothetical protein [Lysobacter gummosus]|uniref:hypothetical protein n=1 Tax=Lysobacter gummosus TaxID=262324 RepID=UPI00362CEBF0